MAIEIKNFNPVWSFIQPNSSIPSEPTPAFFNGTYMFVQCAISTGTQVAVDVSLYDKKPGFITGSDTGSAPVYNDAKLITYLNYGSFTTDVEGNVLLAAHEYIISQSSAQNPGVEFNIIDLSGSVV